MKPNDITTYIWRAKANRQEIILAMLVIVIEETKEYVAFKACPVRRAWNHFK